MAAERALKLGLGALSASREVTLAQIRDRVHGRYPLAQPLPDRPELDRLLKEAGWTLRWEDARQAYVVPTEIFASTTYTSTLPRYATGHTGPPRAVTPEVAEARDFALVRVSAAHGFGIRNTANHCFRQCCYSQ